MSNAIPTDFNAVPHEVDFLPTWYPRLLRWKGIVRVHKWALATITVALTSIGFGAWGEVADAHLALEGHRKQLRESEMALRKMEHFHGIEQQLRVDEKVLQTLGLTVEASRVIAALDAALLPSMALTEVKIEAVEKPMSIDEFLRLTGLRDIGSAARPSTRELNVVVRGLAPSDYDVSLLCKALNNNAALAPVNDFQSRPLERDGKIMRSFEVMFSVDLDYAAPPK